MLWKWVQNLLYIFRKCVVNISQIWSKKYFFLFPTFKIISNSKLFQRLQRAYMLMVRILFFNLANCSEKWVRILDNLFWQKYFFQLPTFKLFRTIPKAKQLREGANKSSDDKDTGYRFQNCWPIFTQEFWVRIFTLNILDFEYFLNTTSKCFQGPTRYEKEPSKSGTRKSLHRFQNT